MILNAMLTGAIVMASLVVSLFFLRFWRSTRDRFFLYFASSFALEALNRILLDVQARENEDSTLYYLIRLFAYGLLLFAVVAKNRNRNRR